AEWRENGMDQVGVAEDLLRGACSVDQGAAAVANVQVDHGGRTSGSCRVAGEALGGPGHREEEEG
uniref:Uncharacterized protein n=1 Tax=Pan troglodytes TaxID=9598 RepID=A0A2I3SZD7_PANTR